MQLIAFQEMSSGIGIQSWFNVCFGEISFKNARFTTPPCSFETHLPEIHVEPARNIGLDALSNLLWWQLSSSTSCFVHSSYNKRAKIIGSFASNLTRKKTITRAYFVVESRKITRRRRWPRRASVYCFMTSTEGVFRDFVIGEYALRVTEFDPAEGRQ